MNIADLRCHAWVVAAAILAGCAIAPSANPAPPLLPAAGRAAHTLASYVFVSECCRFANGGGSITLYTLGLTGVAERITKGAANPGLITIDRSGRLYDIVGRYYDGAVTEYDRGRVSPSRRIEKDDAWAVATDSASNLYVDSCPKCHEYGFGKSSIEVYKAGTTRLLRTITRGIDAPLSLAIDTNDDLYVLNGRYPHPAVAVYAPGSSEPLRKLTRGLSGPTVVALDPSNDVFVMNDPEAGRGASPNTRRRRTNSCERSPAGSRVRKLLRSMAQGRCTLRTAPPAAGSPSIRPAYPLRVTRSRAGWIIRAR